MHRHLFEFHCAFWTLKHLDNSKLLGGICLTLSESWLLLLLKNIIPQQVLSLLHWKFMRKFRPSSMRESLETYQSRVLGPWTHGQEMTCSSTLRDLTEERMTSSQDAAVKRTTAPLKLNSNGNTGRNVNCKSRRLFS